MDISEQTISEQWLKLSPSKTEVVTQYPIGTHDVELRIVGDIVKVETNDKQDGTVKVTYVLKAHTMEIV